VQTEFQSDARGQEGESKKRDDIENETCVFSLMTDFLSCSSLEINKEPGSQMTPKHAGTAIIPVTILDG